MGRIDGRAGQGWLVIRRAVLAIAVISLIAGVAQAAGNAKKVDAELLEFLGSIDAEEEGWQEYLEQKPVRPVEQKPPQKSAPAPRKPDPKQVKEK
jgi:hypothetical protein